MSPSYLTNVYGHSLAYHLRNHPLVITVSGHLLRRNRGRIPLMLLFHHLHAIRWFNLIIFEMNFWQIKKSPIFWIQSLPTIPALFLPFPHILIICLPFFYNLNSDRKNFPDLAEYHRNYLKKQISVKIMLRT